MIALASLVCMLSGMIFIILFSFITHWRRLGIDPQLIVDDIDLMWTMKLAGIVCIISLSILYQLTSHHYWFITTP